MYITADDIEKEISFIIQLTIRNANKKVGLIHAYFVYSFYNVERMKRSTLKMVNR